MAQRGGRQGRARPTSGRAVADGDDDAPRAAPPPAAPSRAISAAPDRLTLLRRQAKQAGLSITSRSDTRGGGARRYNVVDQATKAVVVGGIRDLDTLATELWWRIRERTDHRQDVALGDRSAETCAGCGTLRVGAFRYCRSCGRDFEQDATRPDAGTVRRVSDAPAARPMLSLSQVALIADSQRRQAGAEPAQTGAAPEVQDTRTDDPRGAAAPTTDQGPEWRPRSPSRETWILIMIGLAIGVGSGVMVSLIAATILR